MMEAKPETAVASMEGRKNVPKTSVMESIIPTASAYEPTDEEIQMLIDKGYNNDEIVQALGEINADEAKTEAPKEE